MQLACFVCCILLFPYEIHELGFSLLVLFLGPQVGVNSAYPVSGQPKWQSPWYFDIHVS